MCSGAEELRGCDATKVENLGRAGSSKCRLFLLWPALFQRRDTVRIAPTKNSHGPSMFIGRALPVLKGAVTEHCGKGSSDCDMWKSDKLVLFDKLVS